MSWYVEYPIAVLYLGVALKGTILLLIAVGLKHIWRVWRNR